MKLENKLVQADQRKKKLQDQKMIERLKKDVEFFKTHWHYREETRRKNMKLLQMYEEEKHENILVIVITSMFS